jgi:hypothetical protein
MNNVVNGPHITPWWVAIMPWVGVVLFVIILVAVVYAYYKLVIKKK